VVTDTFRNPFDGAEAVANSNYAAYEAGRLVHPYAAEPPTTLTAFVHDELRAHVLNEHFTCFGGKAALRHGTYRFGLYEELASAASAAGLARDLATFVGEFGSRDDELTTFLASFTRPAVLDERSFERALWSTLQQLHDLDAPHHPWDPAVSSNPADPDFAFSFCGAAFFVVGLHAASSRVARRFAWPTLVFNPHRQFERLKDAGRYEKFQHAIREAETTLQGEINPMLADFGTRSEAIQYSGRHVDDAWTCPFHRRDSSSGDQHPNDDAKTD
jgi:FPC/CPF motif-containing protein YcgG